MGKQAWTALLSECMYLSSAREVFAMEPTGLIVASVGEETRAEPEGLGARLLIAFEQADSMGPSPCRSLTIELTDCVLTGLRIRQAAAEPLTVGLISSAALGPEVLRALMDYLASAS